MNIRNYKECYVLKLIHYYGYLGEIYISLIMPIFIEKIRLHLYVHGCLYFSYLSFEFVFLSDVIVPPCKFIVIKEHRFID